VLAQIDKRWDAVIILDGGADRITRAIFEGIEHPRLKKFALKKNAGPYLCRTLAILNASTDWYAHLDGDDMLPEGAVGLILETIEKNPQAKIVFGDSLNFGIGEEEIQRFDSFNPESLVYGMYIQGIAPLKKEIFFSIGGYAPDLLYGGADWDFWISVAERKIKICKANGITYLRRRRQGSVSGNRRFGVDQVARIITNRHPDFFSKGNRKDQCLGKAYATLARNYRAVGRRKLAAENAEKSVRLGYNLASYQEFVKESVMDPIRYFMRRVGRKIK
jgi:glycosyltransferase involved in cell wall biosynthesis